MDRRDRMWTGFSALLALAVSCTAMGCRSTRSEVPPAKPFSGVGQAPSGVGFGSAPHNGTGFAALPNGTGEGLPGRNNGTGQFGTPLPGSTNYGAPTNNAYGPPGTSSLATPPASSLGAPSSAMPSASDPTTGIPQSGTGATGPAAGLSPISPSSSTSQFPVPTQTPFQ
jgi:hypothetical protein